MAPRHIPVARLIAAAGLVLAAVPASAGRLTPRHISCVSDGQRLDLSHTARGELPQISDHPHQYDDRRRLVSRRYSVSGAVVAELRYAYDAADREIARQYLHRGGRTDFFAYDQDSRLARAELASRPELTEATPAPWSVTPAVAGTWRAGAYQRELAYSPTHSDLVQSTATEQWPSEIIPSIATQLGQADAFGHLTVVDGATRGRDALGQTSTLPLEDGDATLVHDGLGRLLEVTRANGVTVRYGYRADGVRATRQILCPATPPTGPPCEARTDVLVYDGLRLLEVNTVAPVPALRARYYYADEEEIPYAADFLDESTSTLERYYLLTDRQGSVVGALDDQGTWVECVTYDPWGSPIIEPADLVPPSVAEISISSGILQVRFSEAVLPPPVEVASGSTEILTSLAPLGGGIRVIEPGAGDRQISGTWSYAELVPGAPRGSVLLFTPSETLVAGAPYALHVQQGGLLDAWSNGSPDGTRTFAWTDGVQYAGSQASTTTAPVLASLIGNEVLFQAHSYEPLLGLYHMRARVFDPRTGTFLEPDPAGFADAANLYAGFANDTVNNRDPTGASKVGGLAKLLGAGSRLGRAVSKTKLAARNAKAAFKVRRAQKAARTAAERAEKHSTRPSSSAGHQLNLSLGRGSPHPKLRPYPGHGPTEGILDVGGKERRLMSGPGPGAEMPPGAPGFNGNVRKHVEGHAAAMMRQEGIDNATLFINQVPCSRGKGCSQMLEHMLPPRSTLEVIGPDGFRKVFVGNSR